MQKKKLAFLLGITPNLAFAAGNVALSLNRYMKNESDYDIVIYYTALSRQDVCAFEKIPHVRLHQFSFPKGFAEYMLKQLPESSRFKSANALMCFCHFEIFALLQEYHNVAWLDVDTSIQRDISSIINFGPFGITSDTPWKIRNQFVRPVNGYDMESEGVCTAVMIVNDSLPYDAIYKYVYEKAREHADNIINPDQAIMSLMLQDFGITPTLMDLNEWQCIAWKDESITARIVHCGTAVKPWNTTNLCNALPAWYRTHLEWLELGGTNFDTSKIAPRGLVGLLNQLNRPQTKIKVFFRLFGVLPLWKIVTHGNKSWHYLFACLPILKIKK